MTTATDTRIVQLPEHVANQIAAGEVVQRPASVVKELMENALDAGAQRIVVELKDAGRNRISVSDDGSGMGEGDAEACFGRHATSKLRSTDALFEQNRQQPQRQSSAVCCHEEYGHRRQCKCTHDHEVQVPALTTTRGVLGRV